MTKIPTLKDKIIFITLASIALVFGVLNAINLYDATFNSYKPAKYWKAYTDSKISFQYPEEWNPKFCGDQPRPFRLPKVIKGDFGVNGDGGHPIRITGHPDTHREYCQNNAINFAEGKRLDCDEKGIRDRNIVAKLSNGMFLVLDKAEGGRVRYVDVRPTLCSRQLFSFSMDSTTMLPSDGPVGVKEKQFMNSPQYKDIVKFAESIKIKEQ